MEAHNTYDQMHCQDRVVVYGQPHSTIDVLVDINDSKSDTDKFHVAPCKPHSRESIWLSGNYFRCVKGRS